MKRRILRSLMGIGRASSVSPVILVILGWSCLAQTLSVITVDDRRPLAQAVAELEKKVKIPINYEDVPYLANGDVVDVRAEVMKPEQRAAHPNHRVLIPRGGRLSTVLPIVDDGQPVDPGVVQASLNALVVAYTAAGFPGEFNVSSAYGAFFVTAKTARDASGRRSIVQPVLDTKIEFPSALRSVGVVLEEIAKQASIASGTPIHPLAVPLNGMLTQVQIGARGDSARAVLTQLLQKMGSREVNHSLIPVFSYQLLFDPGSNVYGLNIHRVPGF